ncbi:hypothetical protein H2198_001600 [Neophaeococcomyces mojaviensis]|uniref:Uncharacterized protein n=1 Tax=Neophaeococcomyces mojaviensis TaxID=3383035 RepID=A0ACC3AH12_9EURO|nr:hypothetical protein H2198_001600 [Knufia sp. JES_112]
MKYGPVLDFSVEKKIVLITGGGSGIGFALAKICHEAGARIIIGDLSLTTEAQEYIKSVSNTTIHFQHCDVTNWKDLHNLIGTAVKVFGEVPDVYAPVAGIYEPPWSNFWDDEEEGPYKTININVSHPIKLTRLAIRALVGAQKQGVVCLIASTAGIRGNYLTSLYCSSKHAIVGFAKSMGQADPDEGVRIVCVLPGLVDSPLWRDREDDMMAQHRFHERRSILPVDVALVMKKMIENKQYTGGTCVLISPHEERVVEGGWEQDGGKYDPSPRPEADISRIRSVMDRERGTPWS